MKQWFTTSPHILKIKLNGKNQVGSYNCIKKPKPLVLTKMWELAKIGLCPGLHRLFHKNLGDIVIFLNCIGSWPWGLFPQGKRVIIHGLFWYFIPICFFGGLKIAKMLLKVLKKKTRVKWKILPRSSGILWNNSITCSYWKVRSPYHPNLSHYHSTLIISATNCQIII